ncbi:MAG: hypothetical protein A2284_14535, partial [Deltaproteobacteria bacterium RIFOXYA12_FULL_61_11]
HQRKELLVALGVVCDEVFTGPYRILIDPSTWCNLDCVYCRTFSSHKNPQARPHSARTRFLDFSTVAALLQHAKALEVCRVSVVGGAEPTTVPYFERLCEELARQGLAADMSTNGTLLNHRRVRAIVDAGVFQSITVSVSAATAETYQRVHPRNRDKWPILLANLRDLVSYRATAGQTYPHLIFLFAIHERNFHELEAAVALAAELGFNSIWFQMLHVDDWNAFLKLTPAQTALLGERLAAAKALAETRGLHWATYIEPQAEHLQGEAGTWSPFMYRHGCLVGWHFAYQSYQSEIMFCCGIKEVDSMLAHELDFTRLWRSDRYRFLRQHAKFIDPRVNIECANGRTLDNDFCRCCDNHNFNAEVLEFLRRTGLARFQDRDRKAAFLGVPAVELEVVELLDPVERCDRWTMILSGVPLLVRIRMKVKARSVHPCLHLFFTVDPHTVKTVSETYLPLEDLVQSGEGEHEVVVRIDGLHLTDQLRPALHVRVAQAEGDLVRYYPHSAKTLPLKIMSDRSLGGGLLAIRHRQELRFLGTPGAEEANLERPTFLEMDPVSQGEQPPLFRRGEPCRFRFRLLLPRPLRDPLLRLQLHLDDPLQKLFLFGTNTYRHNLHLEGYAGRLDYVVEVPALDLPPGFYFGEFGVFEHGRHDAPGLLQHEFTLTVEDPLGGLGRSLLPLRYTVVGHGEGSLLREASVALQRGLALLRGALATARFLTRGSMLPSSVPSATSRPKLADRLETFSQQLGELTGQVRAVRSELRERTRPLLETAVRPLERPGATEPPPPTSFDLNFTARCNARCRHCSYWKNTRGDLALRYVRSFLLQVGEWAVLPVEVNLLGGEPTIRPDLPEIFRAAGKAGVHGVITTNGYRLAEEAYAASLVETGLRKIVVSLDGLQPGNDALRGPGAFDKTEACLRNLRRLDRGILIVVQTLVAEPTLAGLPAFLDWLEAEDLADHVTFQAICHDFNSSLETSWFEANPYWPRDLGSVEAVLDQLLERAQQRPPHRSNSSEQLRFWKEYFRDPLHFEKTVHRCDIGDVYLGCDSWGDVRICPYLEPVGNLKRQTLREIFGGEEAGRRRVAIAHCAAVCNFTINCRYELLRRPGVAAAVSS